VAQVVGYQPSKCKILSLKPILLSPKAIHFFCKHRICCILIVSYYDILATYEPFLDEDTLGKVSLVIILFSFIWFFLCVCVVLWLELRAFILSHSTSLIFCDRVFQGRVS
jgi:hypothetical protein